MHKILLKTFYHLFLGTIWVLTKLINGLLALESVLDNEVENLLEQLERLDDHAVRVVFNDNSPPMVVHYPDSIEADDKYNMYVKRANSRIASRIERLCNGKVTEEFSFRTAPANQ